jgi:hypothetical protein
MNLPSEYIQLPFSYDADRMAKEVNDCQTTWSPHPSKYTGTFFTSLLQAGKGDGFIGEVTETASLQAMPYIRQVIASLGEICGRTLIARLDADCEIPTHVDAHYHCQNHVRIHIPIITQSEVIFSCNEKKKHLTAGSCWLLNVDQRHGVVNNSKIDRVHLIIDITGSAKFWRKVHDVLNLKDQPTLQAVPYIKNFFPDIRTERYQRPPIMSPGEMQGIVTSLIDDMHANPDNELSKIIELQEIMQNLAFDWQQLWSQYGYQPDRQGNYKVLLASVIVKLGKINNPCRINPSQFLASKLFYKYVLDCALLTKAYEETAVAL